ncbi:hypothetical protein B0H17DRAFT_1199044 [Mycena rosella]|uniref:Uncharacterized protein n=1 Tax=Mycena rosella TaxID=1033263 RepID=A0AAD7GLP3_MYCRO|nr:hypothetical protein B0H17DRAFT_1199044 [Mycena rosella]
MLIPRQPTRVRPGYVAAPFCGSSPQAAFLSARSPSYSCTPRARALTCAPLALVVLLPLLRRPSSSLGLSSLHRAGFAKRARSTAMNGSSSALQRSCSTTATVTSGGGPNWSPSPCFAATRLPACSGYTGLIRVLLAISRALLVCMRGCAAFVLPPFTEP